VSEAPDYSFVRLKDFGGTPKAIECVFGRMAASGDLLPVGKGLYWKAPKTKLGIPGPTPTEVALEVAGRGAGPAGLDAAHNLGLTTQVPSVVEMAVPGRPPAPLPGVRFRSRPFSRREHGGLFPSEVALLEVLRDYPDTTESSWSELLEQVQTLLDQGTLRQGVITVAIGDERPPRLRERWGICVGPSKPVTAEPTTASAPDEPRTASTPRWHPWH
jgi:hypothetical protein